MDEIRILYVDDEPQNLISFKAYFRNDFTIFTCRSGEEGLSKLNDIEVHIIIADQKMANMTGVEFLEQAELSYPDPIRIVLTAHRDAGLLLQACKEGTIFRFHDKPWDWDYLKQLILEAYQEYLRRKLNN